MLRIEIDCGHEIMSFPQTFLIDNPKRIATRDVIQDKKFGLSSEMGWWHHNHKKKLEWLKSPTSLQIETGLEYVRYTLRVLPTLQIEEHNDYIITLIKSNA